MPPVTESELDELLSRPTARDLEAMAALDGDIVVLGASGKMGPTLVRLARRASDEAGTTRRVIGVARFGAERTAHELTQAGVDTLACDLLDRRAVRALPDAPNVVYMVGQKFGTTAEPARTWAVNVLAAANAAERYHGSRMVAFSTGNVYPPSHPRSGGSTETDPTAPVGEYAQSALGRERILAFHAERLATPLAILRLNYAVEPRYGVLRDVADNVNRGEAIDLRTGYVNVIWQRDACSVALRCLTQCATPPLVLNVTGAETVSIRRLADAFAAQFGAEPRFENSEADTALLSDASRMVKLFGPPATSLDEMVRLVAAWVRDGGRSLGKPTRYDVRDGAY